VSGDFCGGYVLLPITVLLLLCKNTEKMAIRGGIPSPQKTRKHATFGGDTSVKKHEIMRHSLIREKTHGNMTLFGENFLAVILARKRWARFQVYT
jgi:hypothetical protein